MPWLQKSAEGCYARAQFNLAVLLHKGDGLSVDHPLACQWLQCADAQGMPEARTLLTRWSQQKKAIRRWQPTELAQLAQQALRHELPSPWCKGELDTRFDNDDEKQATTSQGLNHEAVEQARQFLYRTPLNVYHPPSDADDGIQGLINFVDDGPENGIKSVKNYLRRRDRSAAILYKEWQLIVQNSHLQTYFTTLVARLRATFISAQGVYGGYIEQTVNTTVATVGSQRFLNNNQTAKRGLAVVNGLAMGVSYLNIPMVSTVAKGVPMPIKRAQKKTINQLANMFPDARRCDTLITTVAIQLCLAQRSRIEPLSTHKAKIGQRVVSGLSVITGSDSYGGVKQKAGDDADKIIAFMLTDRFDPFVDIHACIQQLFQVVMGANKTYTSPIKPGDLSEDFLKSTDDEKDQPQSTHKVIRVSRGKNPFSLMKKNQALVREVDRLNHDNEHINHKLAKTTRELVKTKKELTQTNQQVTNLKKENQAQAKTINTLQQETLQLQEKDRTKGKKIDRLEEENQLKTDKINQLEKKQEKQNVLMSEFAHKFFVMGKQIAQQQAIILQYSKSKKNMQSTLSGPLNQEDKQMLQNDQGKVRIYG